MHRQVEKSRSVLHETEYYCGMRDVTCPIREPLFGYASKYPTS